jgi:hypothetical protein
VYYTLLIAGMYAAWRLGELALPLVRADAPEARAGLRRLVTRAAALLALVGFGVALGAVQFIPLLEIVRLNFRSGSAMFEQILSWAYPWRRVIHFLIPNFFGNPSHHRYFDLFTGQWTAATLNALGQATNTIDWGMKNFVEGGAYVGCCRWCFRRWRCVVVWGCGAKDGRGLKVIRGTKDSGWRQRAGHCGCPSLLFSRLALLALSHLPTASAPISGCRGSTNQTRPSGGCAAVAVRRC